MALSEKDLKIFKKWLTGHLKYGPTTVTFTKKDGTERTMNCTLKEDLLPKSIAESKTKKSNESIAVFDLEKNEWRAFRWDSIKTVSFTLS